MNCHVTPSAADKDTMRTCTDASVNLCVWSAPDGEHRAELEPELIQELRYTAIQALLAIPRRGLEIGGLLLGALRKGQPTVFELTEFVEVPCEHRFGPAYTLDEPERAALETMIARYPQGGAVQVVGFYRSYTGRDAEPDEADRELARMFFHSPEFSSPKLIYLVLQPVSIKSCLAGFRFWNDGEMRTEQSGSMFQFDAGQMEQQERTATPPVVESADKTIAPADRAEDAASAAEPEDAASAAEPTATEQEFPRLVPLVSRSSPAANAADATLPQPPTWPQPTTWPQPATLPQLASWPQPQELNDRPEPPGRGEFHSPRFDDPLIAKEGESKGVGVEEPKTRTTFPFRVAVVLLFIAVAVASASLYELWATERETRWAAVHLDARQDGGGLLLTWDARARVVAKAVGGLLQVNYGGKATALQLSQEQLLRGSMTYPDTGPDVLFSLSLDGGGTKAVTESLRVITSSLTPGKAPTPPAGKVAAKPVAVTPVASTPAQGVKSAPKMESAVAGSGSAAHMKAAKPVSVRREILPEIPAGIRGRIATQKVVEVQVRIDEKGRVTSASSSRVAGDGVDQYLADQAVKAARQWLFWPARSTAGEPVSATKTISFEFGPRAN
jgi:TonB family protein